MKITTRRAKIADLDAILNLNQQLFEYEQRYTDQYNTAWTYSKTGKQYFIDRITKNGLIYVAQIGEGVVGYLVAHIHTYAYRANNPIGEIENMFVTTSQRRQGIGTLLVNKLISSWKRQGIARIRVESIAQNAPAIAFYKKLGLTDFNLTLETTL